MERNLPLARCCVTTLVRADADKSLLDLPSVRLPCCPLRSAPPWQEAQEQGFRLVMAGDGHHEPGCCCVLRWQMVDFGKVFDYPVVMETLLPPFAWLLLC